MDRGEQVTAEKEVAMIKHYLEEELDGYHVRIRGEYNVDGEGVNWATHHEEHLFIHRTQIARG